MKLYNLFEADFADIFKITNNTNTNMLIKDLSKLQAEGSVMWQQKDSNHFRTIPTRQTRLNKKSTDLIFKTLRSNHDIIPIVSC